MSAAPGPAAFARRPDAVSWAVVAAQLGAVVAPVYLAAALRPSIAHVALWLWVGLATSGVLNLMHECAHLLTFRRPSSSTALGRWVIGPLVGADFDGYRDRHWAHHRSLGTDEDPKRAYLVNLRGTGLVRLLVRCLSLQEAAGQGAKQARDTGTDARPGGFGDALPRIVAVQAGFLASVVAVALAARGGEPAPALGSAALAYGGVYLYGIGAVTLLAATLRAIAEHQIGEDDAPSQGRAALRNFSAGPMERLAFGSYGFAQHATHHLEPGVPHYRLADLTGELAAADADLAPRQGYLRTLRALARSRPVAGQAAGATAPPRAGHRTRGA